MNITTKNDNNSLTLYIEGRLDTMTAPQLEGELDKVMPGITDLTFDLSSLEYISNILSLNSEIASILSPN